MPAYFTILCRPISPYANLFYHMPTHFTIWWPILPYADLFYHTMTILPYADLSYHIMTNLEFSPIVWSPFQKKIVGGMEVVNRRAFRWAYGFTKYSWITEEMNTRNWPAWAWNLCRFKILAQDCCQKKVAVPQKSLYFSHPLIHNSRNGAIIVPLNTNMKHNYYFNKIQKASCPLRFGMATNVLLSLSSGFLMPHRFSHDCFII